MPVVRSITLVVTLFALSSGCLTSHPVPSPKACLVDADCPEGLSCMQVTDCVLDSDGDGTVDIVESCIEAGNDEFYCERDRVEDCMAESETRFCDRDMNGNGTPDLVDLGMIPDDNCDDCWVGSGCNSDCFVVSGYGGDECTAASDCLSNNCIDGACCKPECDGDTCGSDGCGGTCSCSDGLTCQATTESCICVPSCESKQCGDDGCGGSCGDCGGQDVCQGASCVCIPSCDVGACGDDGCGGACPCGEGQACETSTETCVCDPSCEGKQCGPDGCGGMCGECDAQHICAGSSCECVPSCDGIECGDDGCGGDCGACPSGICTSLGTCGQNADGANCGTDSDCDSGLCNSIGTCGLRLDGETCGLDSDCISAFCNSQGTCGKLSDGEACSINEDCTAGTCTSLGTCGQNADGVNCGTDSDCDSLLCNSIGTCGLRLDGETCGLDGDCISAFCNSQQICGLLSDSETCGLDGDCSSAFCNSQQTCGLLANGATCSAAGDCLSSVCGEEGTSCVEGALGDTCAVTTDCASNYCNYNTDVCTTGAVGEPCDENPSSDDADECISAICHNDGYCTEGQLTDPCDEDEDCQQTLTCEGDYGQKACSDKTVGQACSASDTAYISNTYNYNDCAEGQCFEHLCQLGGDGEPCSASSGDNDCAHKCFDGLCSEGQSGQACTQDEHCLGSDEAPLQCSSQTCISPGQVGLGEACEVPSDCGSGYCSYKTDMCTTGAVGEPCDENPSSDDADECISAICHNDGYCTEGQLKDACDEDEDCQQGLSCEGDYGQKACSDKTVGQACSASDTAYVSNTYNYNDCAEGQCFEHLCQLGGDGDPCSTSSGDNDCAHECIDEVCSGGLEGQRCDTNAPCDTEAQGALVCLGQTCRALGCSGQAECQDGLLCLFDEDTVGACVTGELGGHCAGDAHCNSGLECLDFSSLGRWDEGKTSTVCTDNLEGSPCEDVSGDCEGDLECLGINHLTSNSCAYPWPETVTTETLSDGGGEPVLEEVALEPLADYGLCEMPQPGSPCILALPAPQCSDQSNYTKFLGQEQCGGSGSGANLWLPHTSEAGPVLGVGAMDPLSLKSRMTCIPSPDCGDYMSPNNPYCHGACGFSDLGDPCMGHRDDEGFASSGWNFNSAGFQSFGCDSEQLCFASSDGCTDLKYGDACVDLCADGLKCFGGTCIYEDCEPSLTCDGTSCGDDGCGGACTCAQGSLCHDGTCTTGLVVVTRDDTWSDELEWRILGPGDTVVYGPIAGGEDDWTTGTTHTETSWNGVTPGQYTLQVSYKEHSDGDRSPLRTWLYACGAIQVEFSPSSNWETGSYDELDALSGPYWEHTFTVPETCECTPSCDGKACGDDGCGGSCGECEGGETCNAEGQCSTTCTPSCEGKACGDDGCGGSCGECEGGDACNDAGQCLAACTPNCAGATCGDDGCGGSCGDCEAGEACDQGLCFASNGCQNLEVAGVIETTGGWDNVFGVSTPNIGGAEADSLSIEFFTDQTGSFDLDSAENSNYASCSQCVRLFQDLVGADSDTEYFQSGGTMYVTPSSQPMNGSLEVTLEGVTLVEVTVDPVSYESVVIPGGACWNLNSPLTLQSL